MTDKEKKILFESISEILNNQEKIMQHSGVANSDDFYYTNKLINEINSITWKYDYDE